MNFLKLLGFRKVQLDPRDPRFDLNPERGYKAVWERKKQPSPGAMQYAFETLALVPFPPSGPTVRVKNKPSVLPNGEQQYLPQQTGYVDGIPTVAGQMYSAPLFNPETNSFGIRGV